MNNQQNQPFEQKEYFETNVKQNPESEVEITKPKTKNMLVLGELNRGVKTFENLQKNTGLDNSQLNEILENLENKGSIRVQQKQGLLGMKVEIYPTEKGFKEYYS